MSDRCPYCDSRYCLSRPCGFGRPGFVYVTGLGWASFAEAREIERKWDAEGKPYGKTTTAPEHNRVEWDNAVDPDPVSDTSTAFATLGVSAPNGEEPR